MMGVCPTLTLPLANAKERGTMMSRFMASVAPGTAALTGCDAVVPLSLALAKGRVRVGQST